MGKNFQSKRVICSAILCFLCLFVFPLSVSAGEESASEVPTQEELKARWYEAHDYPVKYYTYTVPFKPKKLDEMNEEWLFYYRKMDYDMVDICNPPDDLLKSLTSEELAELMLEYPFLDYLDRFRMGQGGFPQSFWVIERDSTIFRELSCREDGYICLLEAYRNNPFDIKLLNDKKTEIIITSITDRGYAEIFGCHFINLYHPQFTEEEYELASQIVQEKKELYATVEDQHIINYYLKFEDIQPPAEWGTPGLLRARYMDFLADLLAEGKEEENGNAEAEQETEAEQESELAAATPEQTETPEIADQAPDQPKGQGARKAVIILILLAAMGTAGGMIFHFTKKGSS